MARPQAYPDEPRFLGVVAGFLTFALLEKISRGLALRLGGAGRPRAGYAQATQVRPQNDAQARPSRGRRRRRQADNEVAQR